MRLFVWSDVITFLFQASGGGMAAVGGSIASTGEKVSRTKRFDERFLLTMFFCQISLVGLIAQACSFGLFTILLLVFGYKV